MHLRRGRRARAGLVPCVECCVPPASCLWPRASCLVPRASRPMPYASRFVPRASRLVPHTLCHAPRTTHHTPRSYGGRAREAAATTAAAATAAGSHPHPPARGELLYVIFRVGQRVLHLKNGLLTIFRLVCGSSAPAPSCWCERRRQTSWAAATPRPLALKPQHSPSPINDHPFSPPHR